MYRKLLSLFCFIAFPVYAQESASIEVYGNACEKSLEGESKSSTRVRATDKAVFLGIKKLPALAHAQQVLNDHDLNVLVYRLVDEHIEDLSVNTLKNEDDKVCVEIKGWLNPQAVKTVEADFIQEDAPVNEAAPETIAEVAAEVKQELAIEPDKPENLSLLAINPLEYYTGSKSLKFARLLKQRFNNNPYFYLTDDSEIADYVITPKVLKAKVDNLDAEHKRLQMVVILEIKGLKSTDIVHEQQNRFVLFKAEEDEQQIAARLLNKLIENAADGALRQIEHHAQQRLEEKTLGRSLQE